MLTHGNLAYQRSKFSHYVQPAPGERTLSLLPPWHIYERAVAYFLFSCACEQVSTLPCRAMQACCPPPAWRALPAGPSYKHDC